MISLSTLNLEYFLFLVTHGIDSFEEYGPVIWHDFEEGGWFYVLRRSWEATGHLSAPVVGGCQFSSPVTVSATCSPEAIRQSVGAAMLCKYPVPLWFKSCSHQNRSLPDGCKNSKLPMVCLTCTQPRIQPPPPVPNYSDANDCNKRSLITVSCV